MQALPKHHPLSIYQWKQEISMFSCDSNKALNPACARTMYEMTFDISKLRKAGLQNGSYVTGDHFLVHAPNAYEWGEHLKDKFCESE